MKGEVSMKNIFYVPENISQYDAVVKKLAIDLEEITKGDVPESEVLEYISILLKQYVRFAPKPEMIFWQLDDPRSMPSDCRCEYVYKPTYYATSIIMYAIMKYECVRKLPKVFEVLRDAMNGCLGRNFVGSFGSIKGLLQTFEIFAQGQVYKFIQKYPNVNPKFVDQFNEAFEFISEEVINKEIQSKDDEFKVNAAEKILLAMEREVF